MTKLTELTLWEVVDGVKSQQFKVEEYVANIFESINKKNSKINAYITILESRARDRAIKLDKKISRGEKIGKLAGVAIAIKDNICTKNIKTTCGSHMLENYYPPYNATVINQLENEDAIITGKTNMDEFAMGTSTEHSSYGPTRNPLNINLVPGGSSGGSAAAVASEGATAALGADTGGSIRCPAAFCSLVGLKPTYGLVSRYGLIAYANSFDQIGPITKDVRDTAVLLNTITNFDELDSTSVKSKQINYEEYLDKNINNLKIGILKDFLSEDGEKIINKTIWNQIETIKDQVLTVKEININKLNYALPVYYIIAMSEASSNLARFDGLRYGMNLNTDRQDWVQAFCNNRGRGFGFEVKRRIILGTYILSSGYFDQYYLKAQAIRHILRDEFNKIFKKFDLLIGPTMPISPFKIGEKIKDPLKMYLCDTNTVIANLLGIPAITIPVGLSNKQQIGIQILAPHFEERKLIQLGHQIEKSIT